MATRNTDWFILTCSSCKTIDLARSLTEAGYEAWTPVEIVTLRARRSFPQQEVSEPLMGSYVFARLHHLNELLALSHSPSLTYLVWDSEERRMVMRGHPHFRVMRGMDGKAWAPVADSQLTALRGLERRRRPKGQQPTFAEGDRIRTTDGAYAGLYGTVAKFGPVSTEVLLDGWNITAKLATWLLHPALDESPTNRLSGHSSDLSAKAA
jgi:transcription antitermination factor NusG